MYIVVWTVKIGDAEPIDHWEAFDDQVDAHVKYSELLNEDYTYTVSVCDVIESSDYDC